jgi:hypothetical protein
MSFAVGTVLSTIAVLTGRINYNASIYIYTIFSSSCLITQSVSELFTRTHVNDICFKLVIQGDKLNC